MENSKEISSVALLSPACFITLFEQYDITMFSQKCQKNVTPPSPYLVLTYVPLCLYPVTYPSEAASTLPS